MNWVTHYDRDLLPPTGGFSATFIHGRYLAFDIDMNRCPRWDWASLSGGELILTWWRAGRCGKAGALSASRRTLAVVKIGSCPALEAGSERRSHTLHSLTRFTSAPLNLLQQSLLFIDFPEVSTDRDQTFAHTRTFMCAWETNHMGYLCVYVCYALTFLVLHILSLFLCVSLPAYYGENESMHLKQTAFIYIKHQYNQ